MKARDYKWKAVATWLRITGAACCIASILVQATLLVHYSTNRPDMPRPEHGLTVRLSWTHPVRYGTAQDERRLQLVFEFGFYSFGFFAAGEMIKIYKLGDYSGIRTRPKLPWNHRWGP